jgi:DNA-binding SARP family transcriptional activator
MTARRLASALALTVLLVAIPVLIGATGGPPPSGLPSAAQVGRALTHPLTDHDVLRALAVVGWVLWLLFTLAVAAEVAAHLRHRPSPGASRSGVRVPGLQGVAAVLVLSTLLAGHGAPARGRAAAPAATRARGTATAMIVATSKPPSAASAVPTVSAVSGGAPAATPAPGYLPYTVVRYDSPWAIAAAHLGNGLRWREILDDQGRTLVDGQETVATPYGPATEDTARTIYPGQVLLLPPDAVGLAPAPAPSTTADPSTATVPAPARTSAPPTGPGRATTPPAPPATVWTGSIPEADAAPLAAPAAVELTAWSGPAPDPATATATAEPIPTRPPVWDLLLGGALVASAGINILAFRRSRQAGRLRPGEAVPQPRDAAAVTEMRLRAGADGDLASAVRRAMGAVRADLVRTGGRAPAATGLLVGAEDVTWVVDPPQAPPPPWRTSADRRHWRRDRAGLGGGTGEGSHPDLYPALVPVGRHRDSGAHVLVNLEATPLTAVVGSEDAASALVHGAAVALGGLPWCRAADVVLVGFGQVLASCVAHVRTASSVLDVAGELRATAAAPPVAEDHPAAARLAHGGDGLTPTVVLVGRHPTPEEAAVLREVCRPRSTVRALVAGEVGTADCLTVGPDGLLLPWLAGPVAPAGLSAVEAAGVEDLLRLALAAPAPAGPATTEPDEIDHVPEPSPPVAVQILGSIEIGGLAGEFRRPQAKEILVYLSMHRAGVAEHQLDGAVWPERPSVKPTTRDPVVSAARSAAGGPLRLPFAQGQGPDKRYRVTAEVGTDWDRFVRLHHRGRAGRQVGPLVAALHLVRGRPFADVLAGPGYAWLHLEGHLHHIEAEIVDAADLAAELLLDAGDARRARWAAGRGLEATPYSERLWTRLMAVADALGEAQQIERILAEMDRRLDLEGDFSQLHPDTLAAYRRYSRRSRTGPVERAG